tara:strand:+ start:1089 stop:2096 length:1008 start_codon:yes stop_codon:yes gene_type:complete
MAEQTTIDTPLVDSPEPAVEAPVASQPDPQEQLTDSIEDAIFGGDNQDTIWAPVSERPLAAPDESSENQEQAQPAPEQPVDNDQARYQYWQSEADKMRNTLGEMQKQNDDLKNQLIQQYQNGQQTPQQEVQAPAEPEVEQFPSAPEKPKKPAGFNRAEATEDPSSESARYLDEVESWRDDMDDYNRLYVEYQGAMLQAERDKMQQAEKERQDAMRAQQEQRQAMEGVRRHIADTHGVTDENVVADFIEKMSDPASVSLDNLWKLYQMETGTPNVNPPANNPVPPPSPDFQQTKNAQSIPSPMGVLPSSNEATNKSSEDAIIDDLINDYEAKNPWK